MGYDELKMRNACVNMNWIKFNLEEEKKNKTYNRTIVWAQNLTRNRHKHNYFTRARGQINHTHLLLLLLTHQIDDVCNTVCMFAAVFFLIYLDQQVEPEQKKANKRYTYTQQMRYANFCIHTRFGNCS